MNKIAFKEVSKLRTSDMLIEKAHLTARITQLRSLKVALLGVSGFALGQLVFALLDGDQVIAIHIALFVSLVFSTISMVLAVSLEASAVATKEVITDLLAIRLARTGTKKTR